MSLKNSLTFYLIGSILAILFINTKNYIFLIIFIIFLLFSFFKIKGKCSLILIAVYLFFLFYRVNTRPIIEESYVTLECKVKETRDTYIIVSNNDIYYYVSNDDGYNENDILSINGKIEEIDTDLDLYVFEFKDYLNNKRVFYKITAYSITLVSSNEKLNSKIIKYLTSKLQDETYTMVKMLLFNEKKASEELYTNLLNINALHLFVVSGFHISFLYKLILFFFKKDSKVGKVISILICGFYVYLLDFSIGSSRALICLLLSLLFPKSLSKQDKIAIAGLVFLFIEPLNVFNYSFIMTYIVSYTLSFSSNIVSKQNKIVSTLITSFVCLLSLLPIQLQMNYKINFVSFFTNMFLNVVVTIIFVLCLISLVLSFLSGGLLSFIYKGFFDFISFIDDSSYSLVFGHMEWWMIVIYYLIFILILLSLENKDNKVFIKRFLLLIVGITLLYFRNYFNPYESITFLNVYQGDCCIIIDENNKGVMLVDTGGLQNYDIATKKIIPYLNYLGIKQIDKVVITHEDYDHMGALNSLCNNFIVKEIIQDNTIEEVYCGDIYFENLNIGNDDSDNDSSIVLYGKVANQDVLLMGDASSTVEKAIMEEKGYFNVDFLKVGHHGSSSSTCLEFVEFYNPTYSIISVGKNYYGHPTQQVLENLKSSIVYRTDTDGTVKVSYDFIKKNYIETAKSYIIIEEKEND